LKGRLKVKVNIEIRGQLEVDSDDLKRLEAEGPDDLLRALIVNNSKITSRVTPDKGGK
jgi:hypothetical protein